MRRDFRVAAQGVGALEVCQGTVEITLAIEHPAHAVENERIIGCELERLLDQLLGFRQAQLAIGVRVTEGIVCLLYTP